MHSEDKIIIRGLRQNNLKNASLDIPKGKIVVFTGVSGSGKSSLIRDVFAKQYADRVVLVDQSPVTATGRSTPASFLGFFDEIRKVMAADNGVEPALFSFNSKEELVLGTDCFDKPQRQTVQHDKKKALTMHDDRLVFTEEMVKKEASRCLGCGVSVVDQNKCIGCGLCTTKCEFDAIHLSRDFPENSTLVNIDKMYMPVAEYVVKRAARIAIRSIKEKVSTYKE